MQEQVLTKPTDWNKQVGTSKATMLGLGGFLSFAHPAHRQLLDVGWIQIKTVLEMELGNKRYINVYNEKNWKKHLFAPAETAVDARSSSAAPRVAEHAELDFHVETCRIKLSGGLH